jgi:hypothetical protein
MALLIPAPTSFSLPLREEKGPNVPIPQETPTQSRYQGSA